MRTHFLLPHILYAHAGGCQPLLVELLKRRDEEVAGVACLAYHDGHLRCEETLPNDELASGGKQRPTMVHARAGVSGGR